MTDKAKIVLRGFEIAVLLRSDLMTDNVAANFKGFVLRMLSLNMCNLAHSVSNHICFGRFIANVR